MQKELKVLCKRNEELEETLPHLLHKIDNQYTTTSYNLNAIDALREEVVDLKIALDYRNKVLRGCWSRVGTSCKPSSTWDATGGSKRQEHEISHANNSSRSHGTIESLTKT
jgi:hypothetical protein